MSDKSKANYYGGYALHRTTNPVRGASASSVPSQAAQPAPMVPPKNMMMPFHSADWMMSAVMPSAMGPVVAPPVPKVTVKVPVASPQQAPLAAAAPAAPATPFWNTFLVQSNFYRGSPLHSAPKLPGVSHTGMSAPTAQPSVMVPKPSVPQFAGMWHAFDAPVAFAKAPQHSVEPIGTPTTSASQKKSMWSGTPVSSTKDEEEKWYNPFSLISPPVFRVATKAPVAPRMLASIDASSSDDEGPVNESVVKSSIGEASTSCDHFKSEDINSDDEDWLDHLRDTVSKVLTVAAVEKNDEHFRDEADEVVGVPDAFSGKKRQQDFDPEWSKLVQPR